MHLFQALAHRKTALLFGAATTAMLLGGNIVLAQTPYPYPGQPGYVPSPGAYPQNFRNGKERHPELREAMRALLKARQDLSNADHDFQGHRAQALELTNQAIAQVQTAIASDPH